ncbi:unnamed protein product, partial [Ectocarpus fasciculatus]
CPADGRPTRARCSCDGALEDRGPDKHRDKSRFHASHARRYVRAARPAHGLARQRSRPGRRARDRRHGAEPVLFLRQAGCGGGAGASRGGRAAPRPRRLGAGGGVRSGGGPCYPASDPGLALGRGSDEAARASQGQTVGPPGHREQDGSILDRDQVQAVVHPAGRFASRVRGRVDESVESASLGDSPGVVFGGAGAAGEAGRGQGGAPREELHTAAAGRPVRPRRLHSRASRRGR